MGFTLIKLFQLFTVKICVGVSVYIISVYATKVISEMTITTSPTQPYSIHVQWGEQVFDTLPILQVFSLTKHVEVCNFYHRYTSTVKDGI